MDFLLDALSFSPVAPLDLAPAAFYLAFVSLVVLAGKRLPISVHLALGATGVTVRALQDSIVESAVSSASAVVAFVILVFLAHRILSKVGLFSIVVSLAMLPLLAWPALGLGLLLAAVVGTVQTVRVAGVDRVNMVANETFAAMGVGPGGSLQKPDLERLPTREDSAQFVKSDKDAKRMRLYLPPYLLAGVLLGTGYVLLRL